MQEINKSLKGQWLIEIKYVYAGKFRYSYMIYTEDVNDKAFVMFTVVYFLVYARPVCIFCN